jgi:hypothetical protein
LLARCEPVHDPASAAPVLASRINIKIADSAFEML